MNCCLTVTTHTLPQTSKRSKQLQQQQLPPPPTADTPLSEQLAYAQAQIAHEKAGKRKLFHSLVKLANELRRTRSEQQPHDWYEGGLWRAPQVLPGVQRTTTTTRGPISLSSLFFQLVLVTAWTRVGIAITAVGFVTVQSLLYFAVFWTIWSKEASYSTRFDTSDASATLGTLLTCFAVLFASLSVHGALDSPDATRIMCLTASVALLHAWLHVRVMWSLDRGASTALTQHVKAYAAFNFVMNCLEAVTWLVGVLVFPPDWKYRWLCFVVGLLLALRVPRAFLANDFHAANSKRSVVFILLLGFLLQSLVVVASEFYEYQTPKWEDYTFLGSACLLLFCFKLLYVEDWNHKTEDHALLVNRSAAFFFNLGHFILLLSSTILGSGLNLLTHDYLAAQSALSGPSKAMVCGGFSATLFAIFFTKSMHLKRVPTDGKAQCLFITAYLLQALALLVVVGVTAAMCFGRLQNTFLESLMQNEVALLYALSGTALFLVLMSWLDEGVELILYESAAASRQVRIHPFGFWWCLRPDVTAEEIEAMDASESGDMTMSMSTTSLSVLSPLLGSSAANLKQEYDSMQVGRDVV